ncbi:hypothetical protein PTKIN_Ptkin04bG0057500 [Pterospermum kingtungense]
MRHFFFADIATIGVADVLRDAASSHIASKTNLMPCLLSPKEGEIQGLLVAFEWVRSLGFCKTVFEIDAKVVINAIQGQQVDVIEFGSMVNNCILVLSYEKDFSLSFTRRQTKGVAHALNGISRFYASPIYWDELPNYASDV